MDKEIRSDRHAALLEGIHDITAQESGFLLLENDAEHSRKKEYGNAGTELLAENGVIVLCRCGSATVNVNYKEWELPSGGVITLFPGDIVSVVRSSGDFSADMLVFSKATLREASLDIEHTVYETLRDDRCRSDSPEVTGIVSSMFALLGIYFHQSACRCLEKLVLYQLKAFFIGFHDYVSRFPDMVPPAQGSKRKRSIFNAFMQMLEQDYRRNRDAIWYAARLNITPKYLNIITKSISGHSVKTLIDHYVILKLKQELSGTDKPLKQIAWDYNFSDASFFTRYFRQHTGFTPRAWRLSND